MNCLILYCMFFFIIMPVSGTSHCACWFDTSGSELLIYIVITMIVYICNYIVSTSYNMNARYREKFLHLSTSNRDILYQIATSTFNVY